MKVGFSFTSEGYFQQRAITIHTAEEKGGNNLNYEADTSVCWISATHMHTGPHIITTQCHTNQFALLPKSFHKGKFSSDDTKHTLARALRREATAEDLHTYMYTKTAQA